MEQKTLKLLVIGALCLMALQLRSQVTIGDNTSPQLFSVLEVSTASTKGGLRLPQLTTNQRNAWRDYFLGAATSNPVDPSGSGVTADELANAPGLIIYNTDTGCMEYWNTLKWISLCDDVTLALPLPKASTFTGRTIFDIAKGTTNNGGACGTLVAREPYSTDFTQTEVQDATDGTVDGVLTTVTEPNGTWLYSGTQVYTFTPSATVSNVRFTFTQDPILNDAIISMTPKSNYTKTITAGTPCKAVVVYNPNLMTSLLNKTRDQAVKPKLHATYKDAEGNDHTVDLTVSLQDCNCCGTATTSGDYWQNFLCYNLGANFMVDPFTPAKGLNGDYYQFNRLPVIAHVDGWYVTTWPGGYAQVTGTWTDTEDPCPENYRVPTKAELMEVNNATINTQTMPPGATWIHSMTDFSSGYYYGSVLYLPATGYCTNAFGYPFRGAGAVYPSSEKYAGQQNVWNLAFVKGDSHIDDLATAQSGFSVRCIAK
ncbi:hypothetical protein [Dysgonomonas reticulitermitis]